ncbi:MAG: dihydrolipoyl dehydrogenase family protein, partial [Planctomycetota bacterium]
VLATGSRPRRPDVPGLEGLPYWTSDDVFRMQRLPRSLTIVGGGYIGCELAHFFAGVGVETALVVRGDRLVAREDEDVQAVFQAGFTARIPVRLGSVVASVSHDGGGFRIRIRGREGEESEHRSEALLLAVGRVPNSDRIGLETTGLQREARGFVPVDDRLRTSVPHIHAVGDINGRYMFTHSASFEAQYLGRQIAGKRDDPIDYGPVPHAIFTSPEIAGVGATGQQLREQRVDHVSAAVGFDSATKGRAIKEEHGLCKLLLDRAGRILGCHIVGHQASVLLHEVLPVMKWRNHVGSLTGIIHVHPSLSEIVRGAARKAAALIEP